MAGRPVIGERHGRWVLSRRTVGVLLLLLVLAISAVVAGPWSSSIRNLLSPTPDAGSVSDSGLTSWNPHVSCSADLVTIRDVLGPAYPSQTVNGSRYQTNSTAGGIPQERALSPPCTITNRTGQVLSSFVQINGVSLYGYGVKTTDCSGWYSKQNGGGRYPGNQTFCTNAGQIITIGTTSGYMKNEIDRDWLGKGYCGPNVPSCDNATLAQEQSNGSISLDVQGFVFWEGPYHWELHPFTAWKLSSSPPPPPPSNSPPSVDFSWTPTSGNNSTVFSFTAQVSDDHDSASSIQVRWDWTGDGRSGSEFRQLVSGRGGLEGRWDWGHALVAHEDRHAHVQRRRELHGHRPSGGLGGAEGNPIALDFGPRPASSAAASSGLRPRRFPQLSHDPVRLIRLLHDHSDEPQRPVRDGEPERLDLVVRPRPRVAHRLGEPEQRDVGRKRNGHLHVDDLDLALDDAGHIHGHGD